MLRLLAVSALSSLEHRATIHTTAAVDGRMNKPYIKEWKVKKHKIKHPRYYVGDGGRIHHLIRLDEHPEKSFYPFDYDPEQLPPRGRIYDKKPFRMQVFKGKQYLWCSCGLSHAQPFCDGTHRRREKPGDFRQAMAQPRFRPVIFTPKEDKEVWFCNCKQTNTRPFCDGTHRRQDIQDFVPD